MMEIKLKTSHYNLETRCFICGSPFHLEGVDAVVLREGEKIGDVCEECIRQGEAEIPGILKERARRMEKEAQLLSSMSDEGWVIPSWEEYKFKEDAGI